MGSLVTRVMGFLPANFQLATPFCPHAWDWDRQTDRRTDNDHQCIMSPRYWGGGIKKIGTSQPRTTVSLRKHIERMHAFRFPEHAGGAHALLIASIQLFFEDARDVAIAAAADACGPAAVPRTRVISARASV